MSFSFSEISLVKLLPIKLKISHQGTTNNTLQMLKFTYHYAVLVQQLHSLSIHSSIHPFSYALVPSAVAMVAGAYL